MAKHKGNYCFATNCINFELIPSTQGVNDERMAILKYY